jgi:hypothetical protein
MIERPDKIIERLSAQVKAKEVYPFWPADNKLVLAYIAALEATIAELTASREAIATRLVQAGVEIGMLTMRVEALEREGGAG